MDYYWCGVNAVLEMARSEWSDIIVNSKYFFLEIHSVIDRWNVKNEKLFLFKLFGFLLMVLTMRKKHGQTSL